jgi:hypothetical protein
LDPLFATAVVFEQRGRKLCMLALDVTIITEEWSRRIREAAFARAGISPEAVIVHATQTHSAPPMGSFMLDPDFPDMPGEPEYLRGGEEAYARFAGERAIEALVRASAALAPVRIASGSAVQDGLAFNRRAINRQGRAIMPFPYPRSRWPLGRTDIRYMEGPSDPEVGVMALQDDSGKLVAALLHFTCHPVNAYVREKEAVTSDWPGVWGARLQERLGRKFVPLVLNGCCGNQNPWPPFAPDVVPDERRMGAALAESSEAVFATLKYAPATALDWRAAHVPLPLKPPDRERVKKAEEMLRAHPRPMWLKDPADRVDPEWFAAASVMSVEYERRRCPELDYEVQAFRVGDVAFVGLPGEPFVEGQLRIKIASPFASTFVAHCCSQYAGYLPTREAFAHGGHEVDFSYWAKLAPDSLDRVVETASRLLKELAEAKG